jgi:predicted SAM-dependent methyltransferase
MAKRKKTKQTILKGSSGGNQHTLYGSFSTEDTLTDFAEISVKEDSVLKHEEPNGNFAEHKGLQVEQGNWVMGRQVEYNPFSQSVSRVWD